jgi:hypothetical protein
MFIKEEIPEHICIHCGRVQKTLIPSCCEQAINDSQRITPIEVINNWLNNMPYYRKEVS